MVKSGFLRLWPRSEPVKLVHGKCTSQRIHRFEMHIHSAVQLSPLLLLLFKLYRYILLIYVVAFTVYN